MELTNSGAGVPACDWLWLPLQGLLMAGRDAHPTVVNITFYLKTPISRATHRVAPTITDTPTGSWCYAGRAIQVVTVPPIAEQQYSPNCFALVAQASLPAIGLWMFLQMLLMAGRDAHPTIVNISPCLKTPICARLPNITGSNFSDHLQQKLIFQGLTLLFSLAPCSAK